MMFEQQVDLATLRPHYGTDYFQGHEYLDYQGDRAIHEKTLLRHLRLVKRFVPRGEGLLEMGAAYGFFLELAQSYYPDSVGVELSADAAKSAVARGLDVRTGDLLELDFDRSFAAVCLWDTIEHLPHPYETVHRAVGLLKPGGYMFLTTGDFGAWLPRLQGLRWRQIHPPTHLFYFTRRSLDRLCLRCGLVVLEFGTVSVFRRLRSSLRSLDQFHANTLPGRLAKAALRILPGRLLDCGFPLNLGDTMFLVAQKPVL
ncbi:MAG TPA: class I SAM-dependent methyltransferase [Verrucomicrobiae bacterium]|nr:class I SAM-dependent methyltransferase [Verrucomicrobiae bacterium]